MIYTIVVLTLLFASAFGEKVKEEDGVMVLTKDTFDAVNNHEFVLVVFNVYHCDECLSLVAEYTKAVEMMKEEGVYVKMAKVQTSEETELGDRYEIRDYPTLIFRVKKKEKRFTGNITTENVVAFLKKWSAPIVNVVESIEAVKSLFETQDLTLLAFFKQNTSEEYATYTDVAYEIEKLKFSTTSNHEAFEEYQLQEDTLVLFKKVDNDRVDFPVSKKTGQDIVNFIMKNRLPLVIEFTPSISEDLIHGEVRKHNLLLISKSSEDFKSQIEEYRKAALAFKGEVLFIYIDIDKTENSRILDYFLVKPSVCPLYIFTILTQENMLKYKPDSSELKEELLKAFVQEVLDNKREPYLNSEEVPEDWDSKEVKVLVGKNFDQVARNHKNNVFVMFYKPSDEYSQKIATKWVELAEKYKDNPDIIIAKMDSIANEVEGLSLVGLPIFRYFPMNSSETIAYRGDRELEDFVMFLDSRGKKMFRDEEGILTMEGDDDEGVDEGEGEDGDMYEVGEAGVNVGEDEGENDYERKDLKEGDDNGEPVYVRAEKRGGSEGDEGGDDKIEQVTPERMVKMNYEDDDFDEKEKLKEEL